MKLACILLPAALALAAASSHAQIALDTLASDVEPRVIQWRQHIHQHPELAYQEVKTAEYIADALRKMPGIQIQTGIAKTGIKAVLVGGKPGPVVALRADMDALPVEERNELPFRSRAAGLWQGKQTPVMHACGHDTHVAMLLGAAEILSKVREQISGTVVFLFQPAEEGGGGAFEMMKEGVLDNPKVEAVFGQHINASGTPGRISFRSGGAMASADSFHVKVKGTGGHGGSPWHAKDPIVAAAQMIVALQTVVSRQADLTQGPAVVTVGQIAGGNRTNIIPEEVTFSGTIRTLNEATRNRVHEAITRTVQKTAEAANLGADIRIDRLYPVLHNDAPLTSRMLNALNRAAGEKNVVEIPPSTGSEDFGAYAKNVPVFFWFLSAPVAQDKPTPNHSPLFMIDERHLKTGVKALVSVAMEYLDTKAR